MGKCDTLASAYRQMEIISEKEMITRMRTRARKEDIIPCSYLSVTEDYFHYCSHPLNGKIKIPKRLSGSPITAKKDRMYSTDGNLCYCFFDPDECYRTKNIILFLKENVKVGGIVNFLPLTEYERKYVEKYLKEPMFPQESDQCWKGFWENFDLDESDVLILGELAMCSEEKTEVYPKGKRKG